MLELAKRKIEEGLSVRRIAQEFGIDESTLRKRLKSGRGVTSLGRCRSVFSKEMELELAEHCRELDRRFYGLTMLTLRKLGYEFAELNKLQHPFDRSLKLAGKDWAYKFMKTYNLSLRTPQQTSLGRMMGFNKIQVNRFFENLTELYNKYTFLPSAIFNMDETGLSTVPNRVPKVVSSKGKKLVGKISSGERGETITIVCALSASGTYVPPAIIFPRKRMKDGLLFGAPPESIAMCSESGYMNSDLFVQWLQHFQEKVRASIDHPVLLILDNHTSHLSLEAVNLSRKNNIHLLTIPPHSSHKLQPLDRCFYKPLKDYYAVECNKWLVSNAGENIKQIQFTSLFGAAYQRCCTLEKAVNAFKSCGIWPLNPQVFSEEDFLPSSVTDFPQVSESSELTAGEYVEANITLTCTQEQPGPSNTIVNVIFNKPEIESRSAGEENLSNLNLGNSSVIAQTQVSPREIIPYPKRSQPMKRRNKGKKSEIISASPYKKKLLEDKNKKECRPTPKNPRKKLFPSGKACEPKETYHCPGCGEIYEDPPREDWIKCTLCKQWWHEACSNYENTKMFRCDLCQ